MDLAAVGINGEINNNLGTELTAITSSEKEAEQCLTAIYNSGTESNGITDSGEKTDNGDPSRRSRMSQLNSYSHALRSESVPLQLPL